MSKESDSHKSGGQKQGSLQVQRAVAAVKLAYEILERAYYVLSGNGTCEENAENLAQIDKANCEFQGGTEEHCQQVYQERLAFYLQDC